MTIYVDDLFIATPRTAQARTYGNTWCHLTTDGDIEELHQFAEKIGLRRRYFQDHAQWYLKHYDLTPNKRQLALNHGAVEVDMQEHIQDMMQRGQQTEQTSYPRNAPECEQDDNLRDFQEIEAC